MVLGRRGRDGSLCRGPVKFFPTFGNFYGCFVAAMLMTAKRFQTLQRCERVNGTSPMRFTVYFTPAFTLSILLTNLHTNHLTLPHCAFWSWRGRGVGWHDPAFCRTVRPKGFSGSFQPTRSSAEHVLESEMKCMTQPRVRTCNREAALLYLHGDTDPIRDCGRLRASNIAEDGEDHAPATLSVWTRLFERHPMGWIVPRV